MVIAKNLNFKIQTPIVFIYFILVCKVYDESVAAGTPPHLVMDLTTSGISSDVIKAITRNLGLPTISGSFGEINGIK